MLHLFNSTLINNLILVTTLLGNIIRPLTAEDTEQNFSNLPKITKWEKPGFNQEPIFLTNACLCDTFSSNFISIGL